MKVFLSILLGLFLLCCSAHAKFAHSEQYLAMEQEKLRNQFTMEQNWANKFSHVQTTFSPRSCQFVKPEIGSGAAITVCSVDDRTACHQTGLFKCCENEELRGRDFAAGGHTLNLGSLQNVQVNFFYSGGGFGSGQPLNFCFTIDGSDGVCGDVLFGCSSNPTCGPRDDICEGNIVEGTCNPDPDPARGGGCTCQRGYLAPNCCLCDFPNFYERRSGAGQAFCDDLCRENCDGAPTRFGCSRCLQGYQGAGCCECAPGHAKVGDKCEPICARNCSRFTSTGACAQCKPGFREEPSCCDCDPGFSGPNCERVVCDDRCIPGTFDPQFGCRQCRPGFASPTCCNCQPPYVKVGTECSIPCVENCQAGFFTEGVGCSRCRVGHEAPPLCCDCIDGYMQPSPRAPCTRIPVCPPDQKLENGVCVNICPDSLIFNPETEECDVPCGGDEDLVFLLDYSTSFQPQDLRGILGNLQLISNASNSRSNLRDAVIHYRIRPSRIRPNQGNTLSGYIYDYDDTCEDTVNQLDKFAERNFMDGNRSFRTESYTALNFVARQLPFVPGRRTSIVTITDGFSSANDRISLIERNIAEIKKRASDANARVRFFSIGIRSQEDLEDTIKDIREELKALADGDGKDDNYITYAQFKDYLLNLLVNANIMCPAERDSISSETSIKALNAYIDCTDGGRGCGFSKLKISCSNAEAMAMENKGSLMTEILAAVESVFNDAFKTE